MNTFVCSSCPCSKETARIESSPKLGRARRDTARADRAWLILSPHSNMPGLLQQPTTLLATIDFLDPALDEVPYSCLGPPSRDPPTNIASYPVKVEITDLRSIPSYLEDFTTATSGFQVSTPVQNGADCG